MPLYEYQCDACTKRFDVIQKFSDPPPAECKLCGQGPVRRQLSSPAIQFKGSGFYITDYAKKGSSEASASSGKSSDVKGDASAKSDGATAPSADAHAKSETPTKSDSTTSTTPTPPTASSKD